MDAKNGSKEYTLKYIIEDIREDVKEIRTKDIPEIRAEIEVLKVKAGIWGAIGGTIPVVVALILWILKDVLNK